MTNTPATKVDADQAPERRPDEHLLLTGDNVAMRKWEDEEPSKSKSTHSNTYEVMGYVLKGTAEVYVEGRNSLTVTKGDAYHVPADTEHRYDIQETFSAVEVTSPPAHEVD